MKKLISLVAFIVINSLSIHAQSSEISVQTQQFLDKNSLMQHNGFIVESRLKNIEKGWKNLSEVEDNALLLISLQGDSYYMGNVSGKDKNLLRNGRGITVAVDSTKRGAHMGLYKRDARHGEGIMMKSDGTVVCAKWRWDNIIKKTERPATKEEIEKFEEEVERVYGIAEMATRLERMYPPTR